MDTAYAASQSLNAGFQRGISQPATVPSKPADTALANHARTMANACEMAASNLDRLKRLKARLCGSSDLTGVGPTAENSPQPDGLLARLNTQDEDMSRILNATARLIEDLDGIA